MLAWGSSAAAARPDYFPFFKSLEAPEDAVRQVGAFALDEAVLAATDDVYANLRVFGKDDREVPFLVRAQTTTKEVRHERRVPTGDADLKIRPDNRVQIHLTFSPKADGTVPPTVVVFTTRERNYEKQVSVEGSRDQARWEVLAEGALIFDYSRYMDVRNNRVEIKSGNYRHYRITISNISESRESPLTQILRERYAGTLAKEVETKSFRREDFRIEKVELVGSKTAVVRDERVTRLYTVHDLTVEDREKTHDTVITFRTSRVPLGAITVLAENANFHRTVVLEASDADEEDDWAYLGSSSISRVNVGSVHQDRTRINLPRLSRHRRYRLFVQNQDSPPLNRVSVEIEGEVPEAVFFSEAPGPYRAYYGGEARRPRYDIGAVLQKAGAESVDIFVPGAQEDNPGYSPDERFRLEGRRLLIPAILLVVAVLVWLIARVTRTLEAAPPA
jgi:hypothetical protein